MQSASWAYWLQNVDPAQIAASGLDTVVVEIFDAGGRLLGPAAVSAMGGGADPRLLLGYLSVGEAETYRDYWQPGWQAGGRPAWIGPENPEWAGNFQVRFWADEWQAILFDYLDRMIAAGYDGAWFDVVDVYQTAIGAERSDPASDMVDLVAALSRHAKALDPDFAIYVNGAEELLARPPYLAAIDGVGKENVYFGLSGTNVPNSPTDVVWTENHLQMAQQAGKDVVVIEYVSDPAAVQTAVARATAKGYAPYVGPLDLDRLDMTVPAMIAARCGPADTRDGDDLLRSTPADEVLDGGAGTDTVLFSGPRGAYDITLERGLPVAVSGPDGADRLIGVERLAFADGRIAYDEAALQLYRLYEAAFDRTPDAAGLSFWLAELDAGRLDLKSVARLMLRSDEFEARFGDPEVLGEADLVGLLYRNVLGREADGADLAYWTGAIADGLAPEQFLLEISESAENRAATDVALVGGVPLAPE
jgi:uncharacterized protein (TIGR01370 family)